MRIKRCLNCDCEYKYFPYEEQTTKFCSRSCSAKYNITGRKHKPETIEKMRLSKKGKRISIETRKKISETLKSKYLAGNIKSVFKKGHKSYPLTEDGKNRLSKANSGENNFNWRGGKYKFLRKMAKIRDDYTCQVCGLRDPEIVETDHIKMKCEFPELFNNLENLITLCPNCHRRKTNNDLRRLNTGKNLK
jgi:hypothetical protein